jgi:hypothetical protein
VWDRSQWRLPSYSASDIVFISANGEPVYFYSKAGKYGLKDITSKVKVRLYGTFFREKDDLYSLGDLYAERIEIIE